VRTGCDHRFHVPEFERVLLHLEPREIVMFGRLALTHRIESRLSEAENLLTLEKLLLRGVVERSFYSGQGILGRQLLACKRQEQHRSTYSDSFCTNPHWLPFLDFRLSRDTAPISQQLISEAVRSIESSVIAVTVARARPVRPERPPRRLQAR
jgi:hypothetical protein